MERIIRNSQRKLLAFVVAFAVVFMSIGVLLPATVKAVAPTATDVWVSLPMPEVGQKSSTVTDIDGLEIYAYDENLEMDVEISVEDSSVLMFKYDEDDPGVTNLMGPDDVFDKDGLYMLAITLTDDEAQKLDDNPNIFIGEFAGVLVDDFEIPGGTATALVLDDICFYTVTFDSAGGSAVAPQYVLMGDYAYWPDDPVRDGYIFAYWFDEDGLYYDFDEEVWYDITLTANWVPLVDIISGDNQTFYLGTGGDVVITFNADYNNFEELWIYNNETEEYVDLSKGGFSVTAGSTVLTLNESLLKTMEPGEYIVGMLFMDNNGQESVGYATLNIAEGEAPATTPSTTPATGDSSNIIAFAGMAGAAALGFAAVVIYRKKVTE